jgi:CheY-like chemotaxis protein
VRPRCGLEEEQFRVQLCGDGKVALQRSEVGNFDLIQLDVILPDLGGFDVIEQLGQHSRERPVSCSCALMKGSPSAGLRAKREICDGECTAAEPLAKPVAIAAKTLQHDLFFLTVDQKYRGL